jgi:threonine/homoserine efflux transporter RhtA
MKENKHLKLSNGLEFSLTRPCFTLRFSVFSSNVIQNRVACMLAIISLILLQGIIKLVVSTSPVGETYAEKIGIQSAGANFGMMVLCGLRCQGRRTRLRSRNRVAARLRPREYGRVD